MINKKLNENKIESNHKSLVNMKDEKLNLKIMKYMKILRLQF